MRTQSSFRMYPLFVGSRTPISKFSESKEVKWGPCCP